MLSIGSVHSDKFLERRSFYSLNTQTCDNLILNRGGRRQTGNVPSFERVDSEQLGGNP